MTLTLTHEIKITPPLVKRSFLPGDNKGAGLHAMISDAQHKWTAGGLRGVTGLQGPLLMMATPLFLGVQVLE